PASTTLPPSACDTKCSHSARSPETLRAFLKSIPNARGISSRPAQAHRRNAEPIRVSALQKSKSAHSCKKSDPCARHRPDSKDSSGRNSPSFESVDEPDTHFPQEQNALPAAVHLRSQSSARNMSRAPQCPEPACRYRSPESPHSTHRNWPKCLPRSSQSNTALRRSNSQRSRPAMSADSSKTS